MCIYRPPNYNNLSTFFDEITLSLNRAPLKFKNFIVMGDYNVNASGPGKDKLDEFSNLFDLTNLVREVKCCTNNHRSTIDLILTNRPNSFQKTCTTETGLSDYHKCISTFYKSHYSKLKPKVIHYRNYKNFYEIPFLNDLGKTTFRQILIVQIKTIKPNRKFSFGSGKTCSSKKENCKRQSSFICK